MRLEDEIKQGEFKNEFHKGIVNLIYTFNWLDAQSKDFFKKFDLTTQQYNILRILRGQYPEPSTINLLRDRMLDKMSDASRIVERLRVKNLLVRNQCVNDRRSVDIIISEKGIKLLEKIEIELENFFAIMNHLSYEEMKYMNDLLDKLRG